MEDICKKIDKHFSHNNNDTLCLMSLSKLGISNETNPKFNKDDIDKLDISHIVNATREFDNYYFGKGCYKNLSSKQFIELISKKIIPFPFLSQVLQYCFTLNKNAVEAVTTLITMNKELFTENEVLFILTHNVELKMNKRIFATIIKEVPIDTNYLLQLIKRDEINTVNREEILLLNECIYESEKLNFGWFEFIKTLNIISIIKKILLEKDYDECLRKTKEKETQLNNNNIQLDEFNSNRIDLDLIKKIQNNKDVLQDNIII